VGCQSDKDAVASLLFATFPARSRESFGGWRAAVGTPIQRRETGMRKVKPNTIEELSAKLSALPPVDQPRSVLDAVRELAPVIEAALARGQNLETVRVMLVDAGIHLQRNSLQAYLRRANVRMPDVVATPQVDARGASHTSSVRSGAGAKRAAPRGASQPRASMGHAAPAAVEAPREQESASAARRGHFEPKPDSGDI